jgi:outer membrane protein
MQQKQIELLQPAFTKVQNAIDQVAKDNGFTHILNTNVLSSPILLYADDQFDISNLVLTKLGIAIE